MGWPTLESSSDDFGGSVSISADGVITTVGNPWNMDDDYGSGYVRAFTYFSATRIHNSIGNTLFGAVLNVFLDIQYQCPLMV